MLDRALDALLARLEKRKFGATARPRATKARSETADPGYITNEVRRAVHDRDGEQCTYVSADGVRCTERRFLEFDHRTLRCRGGKGTVDEVGLLCRAHNQYAAELALGADFMEKKRADARAARDRARAARTASAPAPAQTAGAASSAPAPTAMAAPAPSFDADVASALRGMGFKAEATRRAMAASADEPAPTFEARLRAALAATRTRGSEGAFDALLRRAASFAAQTSPVAAGACGSRPALGAARGREAGLARDPRRLTRGPAPRGPCAPAP